jgi:tRNA G26 N,N-dimethylase Trm1
MAEPVFLLQIVDRDGQVVRLAAGGKLELDLVETIVSPAIAHAIGELWSGPEARQRFLDAISERLAEKPIGVFRTKAQVLRAVHEALVETLASYGIDPVAQSMTHLLTQSLQTALRQLKRASRAAV